MDSLQDSGHKCDEYPYKKQVGIAKSTLEELSKLSPPGTMRGILRLLQDKCDSLLSFTYRRPKWVTNRGGLSIQAKEEAYVELACFLSSVIFLFLFSISFIFLFYRMSSNPQISKLQLRFQFQVLAGTSRYSKQLGT